MGKAGENPALTRNRKSAYAESRNAHFEQMTPNNHRRGLRVESEELIPIPSWLTANWVFVF
jgi:hypothetical protein